MSLKPPRSMAAVFVLALAVAVLSAACGGSQPQSPTAPSLVPAGPPGAGTARASSSGEAVGTSSTETAEGQDEGDGAPPQPPPP